MDKQTLNEYINTEEGKQWLDDQKQPLLQKRDELLGKLVAYKELGDISELQQYKTIGSPEEIKSIIESVNEKRQQELNEDIEAKQQYMEEQIAKYKTDYDNLQQNYVDEKVKQELTNAINSAKGDIDVLLPLLSQRVKGELIDGQVNISIYENGQLSHKDGERIGIKEMIADTKNKHPNLFEVSASGSGTYPYQNKTVDTTILDVTHSDINLSKAAEKVKKNSHYESITKRFGWR